MATEISSLLITSILILFGGLFVLTCNIRLVRIINQRLNSISVKKLQKTLRKARSSVKNGMLTAVETAVLGSEAGLTLEQIRLEYTRDKPTTETIENVLGKLNKNFQERLDDNGRFMDTGYANQKFFLSLGETGEFNECPTQYSLMLNTGEVVEEIKKTVTTVTKTTIAVENTHQTTETSPLLAPSKKKSGGCLK